MLLRCTPYTGAVSVNCFRYVPCVTTAKIQFGVADASSLVPLSEIGCDLFYGQCHRGEFDDSVFFNTAVILPTTNIGNWVRSKDTVLLKGLNLIS